MVEINEVIEVEIIRIDDDGKGIGYSQEGVLIIIDGVNENDEIVKVKINKVFEETAFGNKSSKVTRESQKRTRKDLVEGPYQVDDDEDDDDEMEY